MIQHTQGRLEVGEVKEFSCMLLVGGQGIATVRFNMQGDPVQKANARRLAACWNALEGVSTDDIEKFTLHMDGVRESVGRIGQMQAAMERQRDAALALLRELLSSGTAFHSAIELDSALDGEEWAARAQALVGGAR